MKRVLFLIVAISAFTCLYGESSNQLRTDLEPTSNDSLKESVQEMDSIEQVLEQMADSMLLADTLECNDFRTWSDATLSDVDFRFMEWSLNWLDTTDCISVHDTTTLPDSIYKARLKAMPCVIEMPFNEPVRAFIIRYVKRSPKQVARMMRMSEYYFPI